MVDKTFEYRLKGSDIFYRGDIYVQSVASQLPALFLSPQKDQHILDVTAAPGGKTTQIAALLNNTGSVEAWEKNQIRFDILSHNIELQNAYNVTAKKGDALKLGMQTKTHSFDGILLDAPCSAEGRMNAENEKSYGFWKEEIIEKNATLQKELLKTIAPLLKTGGKLVYSTCTLNTAENEAVITDFLEKHENFILMPITIPAGTKIPHLP